MATKKTSIGGQALIEGIMMRGPKVTAMAVRNDKTKEIILEEYPTKGQNRAKFFKLPFIRGIFNMIDSLSFGYKCLMRSAELSGLEDEEENKKPGRFDKLFEAILMPLATVLAVVLALGLFVYLPMQIWKWITFSAPAVAQNYTLRACFEGVMRILLFVGYVWATSLMKDIRRTYMYHGAEHKTIFCYEAGLPLTVENARKQSRFHPRCGTSFLFIVIFISILVFSLVRTEGTLERMGLHLLLLPVVVSISYEIIKWAGRHDNALTRAVSAPGKALQHLTTAEPDDSMLEVAIEALKLVIPEEKGSDVW